MKTKTCLPAKSGVIDFTREACIYLFPAVEGKKSSPGLPGSLCRRLDSLIKPLGRYNKKERKELVKSFCLALPVTKDCLEADADFITRNDPAASCVDEVIMTYPGFMAIMVYRLANVLHCLKLPLVPRIMTEYAHSVTGIDIHPGATIGNEFCIDHGTGIVIGESTIIGKRVKIYQGVTLGALSVKKEQASTKRHPTIEDDVIIYSGSTILGGQTVVGHKSIVGGNVWLTESLPPKSIVYQQPNNIVKKRNGQNI